MTDLCPCAKFQPNPFSSFGDTSPTGRQTDKQTADLISAFTMREISAAKLNVRL